MESLPKLVTWQNQHCENGCDTESKIYVLCDPHKNSMTFFTKLEQSMLKFIWKQKSPQIAKVILTKKSNAGSVIIPDYRHKTIKK
jgi:hypothetical protein